MNKQQLLTKLHDISSETGSAFVSLSNTFPKLIEELEFKRTEKGFIHSSTEDFYENRERMVVALSMRDTLFKNYYDLIKKTEEQNAKLYKSFSNNIELLKDMNLVILSIKDESKEIEVISLNAMIVSIKSGKEGQAFSYITSNLKSLSQQLITESDKLLDTEELVLKKINILRDTISSLQNISHFSHSEQKQITEELNESAKIVNDKINTMLEKAVSVKKPLLKAMESIQMQDIIRQSLEDVERAIGALLDPHEQLDTYEKLDAYNCNLQLIDTAKRFMDDIKKKLDISVISFKENRQDINGTLKKVGKLHTKLTRSAEHSNSEIDILRLKVQETLDLFNKAIKTMQEWYTSQESVLEEAVAIQEQVIKMHNSFSIFDPVITNLKYVAIAQRIEVARNESIGSISTTVEDMAILITQTEKNLQQAQNKLAEFEKFSSKRIVRFSEQNENVKKEFDGLLKTKKDIKGKTNDVKEDLIQSLLDFKIYSDDFRKNYNTVGENIDNLSLLGQEFYEIQRILADAHSEFIAKKEVLLGEDGIKDRPLHNKKVAEILEYLTIHENKVHAAKVAGMEIEEGAEEGEITFF